MMLKGMGDPVAYGPTAEQLGLDPNLTGSYPFGSVGDQYQTCVAAGGDSASCAQAVVETNPTWTGTVTVQGSKPNVSAPGSSNKALLLAALVFFGVVVMRTR